MTTTIHEVEVPQPQAPVQPRASVSEGTRFSSSSDLRDYLTRLLWLMTEGRISPRRASVLAYITTQLLHTHVAAEKEEDADQHLPFIFGLSSPKATEPTQTADRRD